MIKKKIGISSIFAAILLVSITFLPMVSAQSETLSDNSDATKITLTLDQRDGILIIPTDDKKITDLSTTKTTRKSATANLSGTIDKNNFVVLEGTITLYGEDDYVQLSGEATQVFTGWDVPEGAKPIHSKVDNITMTRYEGAKEMYATYVDLQDKSGKYNLHGEFYEDGSGGLVGKVMNNGIECDLGLLGSSISMYENVNPTATTKSSEFITVPQRSQWEIYWNEQDYDAASQACGETCAAMLEEYWSGEHPAIWDIWVYNGYNPMSAGEAQDYLDDQGVSLIKGLKTGSLSYTIDKIENMIDLGRPFYLTENSRWGNCHAVVFRGYDEDFTIDPYFLLNDPNTLTGANTMCWYDTDDPNFNYEENVYEYTGSSDTSSSGYYYLG